MKIYFSISLFALSNFHATAYSEVANKQLIVMAGAGPSIQIVKLFTNEFSKHPAAKGYKFGVPPKSVKHAGGIKWSDNNLFGRTGRPLNDKEKKLNKAEIILAKIPITFAVGANAGIKKLTLAQLEGIYRRKIINWQEVGGNNAGINLLGREPTEVAFSVLKKEYPFFKVVSFDKVFKKDHHAINYLKSNQGQYSIGFGTTPNLKGVNIVKVNGFSVYIRLGLVYDLRNKDHTLVKAAIDFAESDDWKKIRNSF